MLVHWQLLRFPFLSRGVFKYLPTIGRARRSRRTQRWASAGRLTAESIRIDPPPFTRIYRELFGATSEQQHILQHRVDLWPRLAVADARSAAGVQKESSMQRITQDRAHPRIGRALARVAATLLLAAAICQP